MAKPNKLSKLSKECMECKELLCCGKRCLAFFNEKEAKKLLAADTKKRFIFDRGCAKSKGVCCFYNGSYCTIYTKRPTDCRTYPIVIDLVKGKGTVFIDMNCPAVKKKIVDKKFIEHAIKLWKKNWPSENYFLVNSKDNKVGGYKLITLPEYLKYIKK